MSRRPADERDLPRTHRPVLRAGEVGLAATAELEVPLEQVDRLRERVAALLPQDARLYVYAPPLERPGEVAASRTRLRVGEALLEVSGASAQSLAPMLEAAARDAGLPLKLVRQDGASAGELDVASTSEKP